MRITPSKRISSIVNALIMCAANRARLSQKVTEFAKRCQRGLCGVCYKPQKISENIGKMFLPIRPITVRDRI